MRVRAITSLGDWTFGAGQNNYKQANQAIAQNVQTRCLSFLGDCFFDINAGIDWFNFMGGSKNQLALQLALSAVILNTDGVQGILALNVNLNHVTRRFTVTYSATTIYSTVTSSFQYDLGGIAA